MDFHVFRRFYKEFLYSSLQRLLWRPISKKIIFQDCRKFCSWPSQMIEMSLELEKASQELPKLAFSAHLDQNWRNNSHISIYPRFRHDLSFLNHCWPTVARICFSNWLERRSSRTVIFSPNGLAQASTLGVIHASGPGIPQSRLLRFLRKLRGIPDV